METTDKLEMLKEQLEAMTDQMKKMVGALGTHLFSQRKTK